MATSPLLPLRERNFAQVRLSVLDACLALTAERPFAELTVREISERAGISQGTFFNHFPTKDDVLFLFMGLWTLRAQQGAQELAGKSALAAILSVFDLVVKEMARYPRLMLDVISVIALASAPPQVSLTAAERAVSFPGASGSLPPGDPTLDDVFTAFLKLAVKRGELPRATSIDAASRHLRTLFYGVPVATRGLRSAEVQRAYHEAIGVLWRGLGGAPLRASRASATRHPRS